MVSKNLNDVSIYLVPLLDSNITWKDLTTESGFVNAYTEDKNRPYLEDKVFLVYDSEISTKESLDRSRKFAKLETIYNRRYITVNKHHYTVYCFCVRKYLKDVNSLKEIGKVYRAAAAQEITCFWKNVPVPELAARLYYPTYRIGESIRAILPEEDYYPYEESLVD